MTRTIFTNATLLDGEHAAQLGASVAIEGNRITSVRTDGPALEAQPGDRSIDLAGKTLMPGMVQSHFHTTFSNWAAGAPQLGLDKPPPLMTLIARDNIQTALDYGFTSLVCSSVPYYIDTALCEAMLMGLITGPRMLAGSHEIMVPGCGADGQNRFYYMGLTNQGMIKHACGADEMRRTVRTEIARGAQVVKLAASEGHALGNANDTETASYEEIEAAANAAHGLGKKVRAHAASKRSILDCARAGFDIIDHADRLDDEGIEAVAAAGSTIIPSMLFPSRMLQIVDEAAARGEQFSWGTGFLRSQADYAQAVRSAHEDFENMTKMLPVADAAGINITVGDDFGVATIPHGDYVSEFELYIEHVGIAPLDVLRWATKNGGKLMDESGDLGTIGVGKIADLLVVDGDPSSDIRCLKDKNNIRATVLDGKFVKDEL
jgi:imidazolonepropionase-like amidohydrolase